MANKRSNGFVIQFEEGELDETTLCAKNARQVEAQIQGGDDVIKLLLQTKITLIFLN